MKKSLIALAFAMTSSSSAFSSELGSKSANLSMDVALYASVTGLDAMPMTTNGIEGDGSIKYNGSDDFNLESNGQVIMTVTAAALDHDGSDAENTQQGVRLTLDSNSDVWSNNTGTATSSISTGADSVHNSSHSIALYRSTENVSDALAGDYSSSVSVTISGL